MIVPAYDRESLGRTADVAARFPGVVFPAFGVHPWYAQDAVACMDEVRRFLATGTAVAVGEIGMDLAPGMPPEDVQRKLLVEQLDLSVDLGLPVTLHCRRAQEQLLSILKGYGGRVRGALHSFSGSADQMARFLDLGLSIGFSGSVTRETARNGTYRIVRPFLFVTRGQPSGAVKEFIDYVLSDRGQALLEENGLIRER